MKRRDSILQQYYMSKLPKAQQAGPISVKLITADNKPLLLTNLDPLYHWLRSNYNSATPFENYIGSKRSDGSWNLNINFDQIPQEFKEPYHPRVWREEEVVVIGKVKPNSINSYAGQFNKQTPYETFYEKRYAELKKDFLSQPIYTQRAVGGWDKESRQKNIKNQINEEYQKLYNDYISSKLLARSPQGDQSRDEWLSSKNFTPQELSFVTGRTQPNLWAQGLQGLYNTADMLTTGRLPEIAVPGIARSEVQNYNNPLLALAPLSIPAKMVQSAYKDNYSFGDAITGIPNDANVGEDIATDPLTYLTFGTKPLLTGAGRLGTYSRAVNIYGNKAGNLYKTNAFARKIASDAEAAISKINPLSVNLTGNLRAAVNPQRLVDTQTGRLLEGSPAITTGANRSQIIAKLAPNANWADQATFYQRRPFFGYKKINAPETVWSKNWAEYPELFENITINIYKKYAALKNRSNKLAFKNKIPEAERIAKYKALGKAEKQEIDNAISQLNNEYGLGKFLGSGGYGSVYEVGSGNNVIKLGTPLASGQGQAKIWTDDIIESLGDVNQLQNIAIPKRALYFNPAGKGNDVFSGAPRAEVLFMPNLNSAVGANYSKLKTLSPRDRYALFLKQVRQLRDKNVGVDISNPANFRINPTKNVIDIFDVNPGVKLPSKGTYMDLVNQKLKPELLGFSADAQKPKFRRSIIRGNINYFDEPSFAKAVPNFSHEAYVYAPVGKNFTYLPDRLKPYLTDATGKPITIEEAFPAPVPPRVPTAEELALSQRLKERNARIIEAWRNKEQKKEGGPIVNSNGYKDGRPSKGSNWRIPGNTIYNPTGETILAKASTGEKAILQPYDTNSVRFKGADYVDEYHLTNNQPNWLEDYKVKLGGPYNSSWMLTNPKPKPVYVPKMQKAGQLLKGRDYVEQWMNSPMYQQMLSASAQGPEFERISKGRISNLSIPTNVFTDISLLNTGTLGEMKHRIRTMTNATFPEREEMIKILQTAVDNPKNKEAKRKAYEVTQPKITGWNIAVNPELKPGTVDYESVLAHEYGHTTDSPFVGGDLFKMSLAELKKAQSDLGKLYIPESDIQKMKNYQEGKVNTDYDKYVSKPQETRQFLNHIRYLGKSQGVYDPFTQKITPEQYRKIKPTEYTNPAAILRSIYTDDQIIDMLNSISRSNISPSENIFVAAFGGVLPKNASGGQLPKAQAGIDGPEYALRPMTGDIASYYSAIRRMREQPKINKTKVEIEKKRKQKLIEEISKRFVENQPTIGPARPDYRTDREKAAQRDEMARREAMRNSALAQTFGSFTPSGSPDAGVIGAETFVNMNPLITGPFLSGTRLYGQASGQNPYGFGESTFGNVLGAIGVLGDVAFLRSTVPSGTASQIGRYITRETPVRNTYKLNPFAEKLKDANKSSSWSMQELPGLHLKSTMSDGAVSKIVEPKTGLVNVEQALGIIGKESGGADKVALIKQGLGETFPKKMDYNEFRKVVQNQLIPLERQFAKGSSNYGLPRIGYSPESKYPIEHLQLQIKNYDEAINNLRSGADWTKDLSPKQIQDEINNILAEKQKLQNAIDYRPIENQTLILSNKSKFGRGSSAHGNPEETLGHIHFFRDVENPDVLTVTQIQSDAFQGTHRIMPKNTPNATALERQQKSLQRMEELQNSNKSILNKMKTEGVDEAGLPVQDYQIRQFEDIVKGQEQANLFKKADIENFIQKQLLDKNHQERYLQELVNYAGERGDVNKVRLPTSETAAKVQGYKKKNYDIVFKELEDLKNGKISDVTKLSHETKAVITTQGNTSLLDVSKGTPAPRNYKDVVLDLDKNKDFTTFLENKKGVKGYDPEHQTILKKYAEQPKNIKKLFGVEPKIVTDSKGNTWYEFDIPEGFKGMKGEIKAFSIGGMITPPAAIIGAGAIEQKKNGGQHGGLDRWFAEKWVDIKSGKACGRQKGESRAYPACRPSKRVSSKTPKTSSELSSEERAKFKSSKTSSQRIPYSHKRRK